MLSTQKLHIKTSIKDTISQKYNSLWKYPYSSDVIIQDHAYRFFTLKQNLATFNLCWFSINMWTDKIPDTLSPWNQLVISIFLVRIFQKKKKKKARHTSKVNTIKMMQKNRLRILTGKTHPKIKLKQLWTL